MTVSLSLFVGCLEDVDQFLENFVSFVKIRKLLMGAILEFGEFHYLFS